jgi:hypothetical protein
MVRGFGFLGFAVVALGGVGLVGAAAVSAPRPAAVTTTTPTTGGRPIPIPRWHLEGTHEGIEHFALRAEGCSQLDHHLDETMVMTSRSVWHFAAHYCGVIGATGLWSGAGTFTMANTTGATFRGSFSDSAQLPSRGVPYTLHITSGTGAVSGAHGTCALSNNLVPAATPGVQHQSGDLSCDVFR